MFATRSASATTTTTAASPLASTHTTYSLPAIGGVRTETRSGGLQSTGSLDAFEKDDITPVIGTEFTDSTQLRELLNSPKRDVYLRDLAILVSQRGVVFFRDQDLTPDEQSVLVQKLGELTGKPSDSTLHLHPVTTGPGQKGDPIVSITSARPSDTEFRHGNVTRFASNAWHSDISFENVPSDYACLRIHTLPTTGADTLWASTYEVYDRLSPEFRQFLREKTATHDANFFHPLVVPQGLMIRTDPRGSPANIGSDISAVHPVIRTNPVTGWNCVYANQYFARRINEVSRDESDMVLKYLATLVAENHDLQVRFRWRKNSVAIWDNRSTVHTATHDTSSKRVGERALSVGERPYLDPNGVSRRTALGLDGHIAAATFDGDKAQT